MAWALWRIEPVKMADRACQNVDNSCQPTDSPDRLTDPSATGNHARPPGETAMRRAIALLTLGVAIGSADPAFASEHARCSVVLKEKWLAMEIVKARLTELGFDVRGIKSETGCDKIKSVDKKGAPLRQSLEEDADRV
jgi:hypothetical protein